MKVKSPAVLLLVVSITGVGMATATSSSVGANAKRLPDKSPVGAPPTLIGVAQQRPADEPGVINGAKNPDLIPDNVAYSLLFRLVAGNQSAEAKGRIKNYVRQMGLGDCRCPDQDPKDKGNDKDVDAFIAAADEFQKRVSVLDQQAIAIKKSNWPNLTPEVMARLTQLQRQKEAIVAEVMASLPKRLSAKGMDKVRLHIKERVKKNVKMKAKEGPVNTPSLAMLSGDNSTR